MTEETKPKGIRILVPEDEFGTAYGEGAERQWVERRQRIGRSLVKELREIKGIYTDDKAYAKASNIHAKIFTDWTLEGDEGPLSKPWGNPKAFEELIEADLDLSLWVFSLIGKPIAELLTTEETKN